MPEESSSPAGQQPERTSPTLEQTVGQGAILRKYDSEADRVARERSREFAATRIDATTIAGLVESSLAPGEREALIKSIQEKEAIDKAELGRIESRRAGLEQKLAGYAQVLSELQGDNKGATAAMQILLEAIVQRAQEREASEQQTDAAPTEAPVAAPTQPQTENTGSNPIDAIRQQVAAVTPTIAMTA